MVLETLFAYNNKIFHSPVKSSLGLRNYVYVIILLYLVYMDVECIYNKIYSFYYSAQF